MNQLYEIRTRDVWAYLKTQDSLFWLINIYLFLEYVRPQTLYPALNVIPWSKSVLLVSLALFFLQRSHALVRSRVNTLLLLFFVVVLLSSLSALSPDVAFDKMPEFIAWMIIYFLIINIVNTEKRFLVFMLAFLLYSFKMSQFSFKNWASTGFSFLKDGSGGGPGWFNNSGEFGIQMCIFLPLAAYFFLALQEHWPRWKKAFFFLFPFTALTGTVSSSSRGALLGAGAVLLFMFMKSKRRFNAVLVVAGVAVLVYTYLPEAQKARFESAGTDTTSLSRLVLWESGMDLLSRYPVLGVGYRNWGVAQREIFGAESQLPHNIFIECASELGWCGLFVFVLMIVFTFATNSQTRKSVVQHGMETPFMYNMALGLDGALIGYLVSGFFVTVLYYPYFWINLAMTVALNAIATTRMSAHPIDQV